MKHPGLLEIEVKIPVADLAALEPQLRAAGFVPTHPEETETSQLWDRDGELQAQGSALRIRRYGAQAWLTWKGRRVADPRLKIRPELETPVADPEATAGILAALGFQPTLTIVKRRALWQRGDLEACLDATPFGRFLELEGPREAIQAALEQLGLEASPIEPRSYATLFEAYQRADRPEAEQP